MAGEYVAPPRRRNRREQVVTGARYSCHGSETDCHEQRLPRMLWTSLRTPNDNVMTPASRRPITPGASSEAVALLSHLDSINGDQTLAGQHCLPFQHSKPSDAIARLTGRYPALWGGEWGFSDDRHDSDNIKFRPDLIEHIRLHHRAGRVIVLTYHQGSPTVGEPCHFKGGVQLRLTPSEWDDILTTGSDLNMVWRDQVDRLARALTVLRDEGIPVIFRPYHEMNGTWFWWGGDPARFKALWRMLFDRYVREFQLVNLLWAWTCDKPYAGVEEYFPGLDEVDMLGADIYPVPGALEVYPQEWFDRMRQLAGDKPLGLSEMSVLPSPAVLKTQPWCWFMAWGDMVFEANSTEAIRAAYSDPRVVTTSGQRR